MDAGCRKLALGHPNANAPLLGGARHPLSGRQLPLSRALAAPHAELLAIVKANAYGHSLELCAPAVVRAGARWLGVASVEEGVAARRALCPEASHSGHRRRISRSGSGGGAPSTDHRRLGTMAVGRAGIRGARGWRGCRLMPIHLEIDTGMSRQGVGLEELAPLLARFHPASPLRLDGVMTHFFAADEADGAITEAQLARMDRALAWSPTRASIPSGSISATPPRCWPSASSAANKWVITASSFNGELGVNRASSGASAGSAPWRLIPVNLSERQASQE